MPVQSAKLKSSWLTEANYDDETQTLTVHTRNGTKHEHQVAPHVFQEMVAAPFWMEMVGGFRISIWRLYHDKTKRKRLLSATGPLPL